MKNCTKCGESKPYSDFNNQSANKDGLTYYCKACTSEYHKGRYLDPGYKNYQRDSSLRNSYGISLDEYNQILQKQNGVCAICGNKESRRHHRTPDPMLLAVDHCHDTSVVRGLLCSTCNLMLGHAKDSVEILKRAIEYLGGSEV